MENAGTSSHLNLASPTTNQVQNEGENQELETDQTSSLIKSKSIDLPSEFDRLHQIQRQTVIQRAGKRYSNTQIQRLISSSKRSPHTQQLKAKVTPGIIQRFEAPRHEGAERAALTTPTADNASSQAMTNEEASAVYFGNWMRDMNQVFVPTLTNVLEPDAIFSMISYLGMRKFGRSVDPQQFGYYIPAEHIDNPAGLVPQVGGRNLDLLPGQPQVATPPGANAPAIPPASLTPQARVDPQAGDDLGAGVNIFSVDQTGVMAYMRRSNIHVERRLELSAKLGRNPDGMMHFGAALHAIEDLFAHSNWIEIAVGKLLQDDAALLPNLHGQDRQIFNFSPTVQTPGGNGDSRPALTTGSFTGTDTQISLSSELVNFLSRPLPNPQTDSEAAAAERLVHDFLRTSEHMMQDPRFRATIRQAIMQSIPEMARHLPGLETTINTILQAPLTDIYDFTRLPRVPDSVRNFLHIPQMQQAIRNVISSQVLQPAARQVQAASLDARIQDTSLLNDLSTNQRYAAGNWSASEQAIQQNRARAGGATVAQQQNEGRQEGQARANTLSNTPEQVVAGPSHSQLAKDHSNSPFFGLAFLLATRADQLLRDKMLAAWAESAGHPTSSYQFPGRPAQGAQEQALYDRRAGQARSSLNQGREIVQQGHVPNQSYDLRGMRQASSNQIQEMANILRAVAQSPNSAATQLQRLKGLMQSLIITSEMMARTYEMLDVASHGSTAAGKAIGPTLANQAAVLDSVAAQVVGPADREPTHDERQATNEHLTQVRDEIIRTLATNPSIDRGFSATLLILLNRQISNTAVTYTTNQRNVLEGRNHVQPNSQLQNLQVQQVNLPNLAGKSPAVAELLQQSRLIFTHPYEGGSSAWWVGAVQQFIAQHQPQIAAEIEARNAGYPTLRIAPGQTEESH